jgi:hypothetical protein
MNTSILYLAGPETGENYHAPKRFDPQELKCLPSNFIVLNIDTNPPSVIHQYKAVNFQFFNGLLPEQFIDAEGQLRTGTGRLVFPNPGVDESTQRPSEPWLLPKSKLQDYSQVWTTDTLVSPSSKYIPPEDITDFLTVLDSAESPLIPKNKKR